MFISKRTTSCCEKVRWIHMTSCFQKTHYDSLGITRRATQNDIKNAYYKLSMLYHPDKNSGSEIAAQKFRDINTAYEVLGNFRLRKLYDKGMLRNDFQTVGKTSTVPEEDPETKFYESHINRSKPPAPEGQTRVFNFDEWNKHHYANSFQKKLKAKEKFDRSVNYHRTRGQAAKAEAVVFGFAFVTTVFLLISYSLQIKSFDTVEPLDNDIPVDLNAVSDND